MALYLIIQVGAFLSRIIPRPWRFLIGTAVGDAVYFIWSRKRRVLLQNMSTVLGAPSHDRHVRRYALKSMRNYMKYLIEFLELPTLSSEHPVIAGMKVTGLEHLLGSLERRKGIIIATAHFGTIEVPGLRLTDFTEFHAVYDTFRPAYLDRLIQRKRREKRIDLIPATNVRAMLKLLHEGGTLAMLFDRPVDPAKGVAVSFFGRETAVPGGPAALALKTGATILPVFTSREPNLTFSSEVYPPVTWTPSGDRERDMQTIMQKLMNALQDAIRRRPDQWYMFRPMWPEAGRVVASGAQETADGPA